MAVVWESVRHMRESVVTIRAFIAAAGSADLLDICLASLEQYAPEVAVTVVSNREQDVSIGVVCAQRRADHVRNPHPTGTAADHAAALDFAKTLRWDYEYAVTLDSDVVILSSAWQTQLVDALQADAIGAWGVVWPAESPRLHPMCLAMKAARFRRSPSFSPSPTGDTGAAVCEWLERHGLYLAGLPVDPSPWTLSGVGRWWATETGVPLLAHLGGGTHTDAEAMTRTQRLRHWAGIRDRHRFIRAAVQWLKEHP